MQDDLKRYRYWVIISIILTAGLVTASFIMTRGFMKVRESQKTIEVVGSAKKQIRSDLVIWSGSFSAQSSRTSEAYAVMKQNADKVRKFLASWKIADKDMVFSSITTNINYVLTKEGNQTSRIDSYKLTQQVQIRSSDVDKIAELSRKATELLNEGVEFSSGEPQYYYTKIADLKIEVLSMASKDAKVRAEKVAENTGCRIGRLASAYMGVFQITPLYSTEVSDLGVYDTTSIDKEITSVVICRFDIDR